MMIKLSDYFNIQRGNAKNLSMKISSDSTEAVRLVSSTATNNGGTIFVIPNEGETIYKNVLTINNNGSVGYVFFHPYNFIASSDVTIIEPKEGSLNEKTALYIKTAIEKQKIRFAYGYKISNRRLNELEINLPVTKSKTLDYKLMKHVISEEFSKFEEMKYKTLNSLITKSVSDREWKQFMISSIFKNIKSGTDFPQYLRISGITPFVGSSSNNNGITDYIGKNKFLPSKLAKNVISVNRNGSVGYAFYHPYEAYFSGDTRYICLNSFKNTEITKRVAIFLTAVISQQKHQFSYGFKLGTNRLKKLIINLPVDENGDPDWKFMNDYIASLPNGDLI